MNRKLVIAFGCFVLLLIARSAKAQAPVANFKGDATSGCGPLSIRFTDLSTNGPLFWSWDFGNGQTSNQQNPLVTYVNPGTYTVTLTVRNKDGVDTKQLVNYINVFPYPHANYTNSLDLACVPANVQFTDISTPAGGITSWNWDFGDGSTSNQPSPSHTYTTTGYFNVSLTVSNPGGCTNKYATIRTVRVVDGVQPNFIFDQVSASCLAPYTVNFLNQTAGPGTLTYNWSLGSGASPSNSNAQNPTGVSYPSSVDYTVTLQVQSSYGCGASVQKTLPFGSFAAKINGPDTVCINTPATFSNGSTPPNPAGMTWKFGDGTTGNSNPIAKTYKAVGFYPLTLVNRYKGCVDSVTKTIQVASQPVPGFTATNTSACKPNLTVNFTDATAVGIPVQWNWNFGDGSSSTQRNPQHTYTQFGAFDVTLTVTGAGGCSDFITKKAFVNVQAPTVAIDDANNLGACINGITGDKTAVSPIATINSVDPSGGYTYSWSAPGSIEGSSTSSNPSFHYTTQSTYNITVTVTSPIGCQATSPPATVQIGTPLTAITYSVDQSSVCGRDSVTFTATTPPVADHYRWDFGDLTNSGSLNLRIIKHSYDTFGNFSTYLTAVNHGCPYTSSVAVNIAVKPPIPRFGYKVINCPNTVNFLDSSLVVGPATYLWDFDEAGATSPLQNPTYPYTTLGLHHVTLTVTNGSCGPQSYTRDIFLGQISVAGTPAADTVCTGINFHISDTSIINPTPYPDNYISTYIWKLDTFPTITQTNPVFTAYLKQPGIVNLTLQVRDTNGCVYPITGPKIVAKITATAPTATFTFSPDPGQCKNSPVTFTDHSTPDPNSLSPITSWKYNFGDSTTGSTQNPTHPYIDTGYFHISLKVTDAQGCTATFTAPDSIQVTSPYAAFSGPDSFYCPGVPLQFIDSSFGYNITENWDFGDSSGIVSGPVPPHTYATPGTKYTAVLTVTDKYNCISTYTKLIDIEKPVAAFDIADTFSICIPLQTQFTAHTQFIDSLYWDFGDGTTSTLPVTSHFYNSFNNFTAKLYAFGPGGCFDTASRRVQLLNPVPATTLTYSPLSACDSLAVQFDITVPPYTSFYLAYDDPVIDSSQNLHPLHMYRGPNPYHPRLGLSDPTGCFVSIPNGGPLITILGATPFFSIDKHKFCDSSMVTFLDYTFSNNGIDSETYVFGDGSPSQTQSPGTGSFNVQNFFTRVGAWPVSLKVSTDSGCHETYNDTVFVYQTPHPIITLNSNPCAGIVQFQGSLTQPEVDTIKWTWNFGNGQTSGNQNPAIKMNPGNYTVTLIASVSLGCADTTSDDLTIHPLPLVSGPKEITTPLGIPVTIPFAYSAGVSTWQWNPATNLDCPTCPDPVATLLLSTQYSVTVTDSSGCKSTDSIFIRTICNTDNLFMPNTFSPNGDGVNDVFYPRGKSLYNVQSLQVFNRWGQMVFQRRDFPANTESMGWDGRINGKPAPSDAYVYIVEVICENAQVVAIHGTVTLLR